MNRHYKIWNYGILDIWYDMKTYDSASDDIVILHTTKTLEKRNYDYVLSGKTYLLDLSLDEIDILRNMEYKSCRYAINRSFRDGVVVRKAVKQEEICEYLEFQNAFCKKKGALEIKNQNLQECSIYVAESPHGEFLGGCAFIENEDEKIVRYKYAATSHKLNANEAILWHVICEYKKRGYKYFDFGGVIPTDDKTSYYYRHYRFKKKWGGNLVDDYIYIKSKGIVRIAIKISMPILMLLFKNNYNEAINWVNRHCNVN